MRNEAPGATIEISASGPAGLTGTLGVRLRDGAGGDAIARTTAGIVADVTVNGRTVYRSTMVMPTTQGDYLIVWDDPSIGPFDNAEAVRVTSSNLTAATPSGRDLTTVAAVKEYQGIEAGETSYDSLIQDLVTAASLEVIRWSGRDFNPENAAAADRDFDVRDAVYIDDGGDYVLVCGDLSVLNTVKSYDYDGVLVETVASGLIVALPRVRASDAPIEELRIKRSSTSSPTLYDSYTLRVNAEWGFPAIPDDVAHWTKVQAALWFQRDVRHFSTTFNLDEQRFSQRPRNLDAGVRAGLTKWRRNRV